LKEETGISRVSLSQLHLFSEPKRDPRGWIVSCSFIALADEKNLSLQFGEDAIDAQWFDVEFHKLDSTTEEMRNKNTYKEQYDLEFSNEAANLTAKVEVITTASLLGKSVECNILHVEGIAFDHAKIIAFAIEQLFRDWDRRRD
jgi:oxygen-independent coproporphyrinogen-3 oxidase